MPLGRHSKFPWCNLRQEYASLNLPTIPTPMSACASQSSKPARILVVDDHPMIRERLVEVIDQEPGIQVCGQAEDHKGALVVAAKTRPDLIIVDLLLKGSHGLDLIKDLRLRQPTAAILVVSMQEESLHAERAIRAGALGFINKQEATRNIILAIRTVLQGDIYVSESMTSRLTAKIAGKPRAQVGLSIDLLTDRELRVLEFLGTGHSTRQIAALLRLKPTTIETYRARIKQKLGLRNGAELLQHAINWAQAPGSKSEAEM